MHACFFLDNRHKYDSSFSLSYPSDSGIGLERGVFVATLAPGSPAARDCALTVGDRLLAVSMMPKNLFKKQFIWKLILLISSHETTTWH